MSGLDVDYLNLAIAIMRASSHVKSKKGGSVYTTTATIDRRYLLALMGKVSVAGTLVT